MFIVIVVAILVAVPSVVMFDTTMWPIPVALKVLMAIVMRRNPVRSDIRRPGSNSQRATGNVQLQDTNSHPPRRSHVLDLLAEPLEREARVAGQF